jgi:hypothetical protein
MMTFISMATQAPCCGTAEWQTAVATWWLAIVAALALVATLVAVFFAHKSSRSAAHVAQIAQENLDAFQTTERAKRTEEQVERFESGLEEIHSRLIYPNFLPSAGSTRVPIEDRFWSNQQEQNEIRRLLNYFSWVEDLSKHHLLIDELYFGRLGTPLVSTYIALRPLLAQMEVDRLVDSAGFRAFAVRAFQHIKTWPVLPVILDNVKLNEKGDDFVIG